MVHIDNFVLKEKTPKSIIEQYKDKIPEQITDVWKKYGFGIMKNGYLKVVNPNEYRDILSDTYVRHNLAIPLFTTAMGDILVWEDGYLLAINYRKHQVNVVAKNFKFFFGDLSDNYYLEKALDWLPYPQAVEKYGNVAFDECFGYVPLLGLGGSEKVDNLKKVKLIEHIYLITQFMGPIE
ncbi:T6SS immunity protein Tdi1 domain-containing protein [Bacillus gobiensis]|uniref:T6SS immunity protein Tdi1 domain-containing protein n=1 Tax=Bacillus gobiensis TaxID=1441095 RepID=UPI003D22674E